MGDKVSGPGARWVQVSLHGPLCLRLSPELCTHCLSPCLCGRQEVAPQCRAQLVAVPAGSPGTWLVQTQGRAGPGFLLCSIMCPRELWPWWACGCGPGFNNGGSKGH